MRWVVLVLVVAAWAAPAVRGQVAGTEEVHRLVEEKDYAGALRRIGAGLALKGPAAKTVSRYELLMLKGECHLQTRASRLAAEAYANAAKEAADGRARALAAAHEALARRAKGTAFTPKFSPGNPRPVPIDILDEASRKRAFAAMLADDLATHAAAIAAAKSAKGLGTIAAVFEPLGVMEGLELAAVGEAPQVTAIQGELAAQVKRTVAEALRGIGRGVGAIDKDANAFVEFYEERQDPLAAFARPVRIKAYKKKGLSDQQTRQLQEANATCDKIAPALAEMAEGLRAPAEAFDPFVEEAARIRREVDRLLDTDYQRVYREVPKK